MVPFYISACVHAFFILYILLVLPESLSSEARAILTANAKVKSAARKRKEAAEREWEETDALLPSPSPPAYSSPTTPARNGVDIGLVPGSAVTYASSSSPLLQHRASRMSFGAISLSGDPATHSKRRKRLTGSARRWARTLTAPLQPLEVFMPTRREAGEGRGMDWSMTLVACAMFLMATLMVCWMTVMLRGVSGANMKGLYTDQGSVFVLQVCLDVCSGELDPLQQPSVVAGC
jgi:hypothetical protein